MRDDDAKRFVVWIVSGLISFLLAGNIYFVKKLVDQVDETTRIVWQLRQDVVVLKLIYEERKKSKGE
jgi:hypothetical protein